MQRCSHRLAISTYLLMTLAASSPLIAQRPKVNGFPTDLAPDSTTILGITLGQSNLATVRAKFGQAELWRDGDASTAESKVCYVAQKPNSLAIIFASNAEMAPGQDVVTDIRILKLDDYKDASKCLTLALGADQIRTASGLKIGISRENVRAILGPSSRESQNQWSYDRDVERLVQKSDKNYELWLARRQECFEGREPYFTISSGITVRFRNDSVVALIFSRNDSIC
jgi:hypothetical protein